jgi:hypothetical protein
MRRILVALQSDHSLLRRTELTLPNAWPQGS